MLRFFAVCLSPLLICLLIVISLILIVTRQAEPNPLMQLYLPDESCPAPCWYGINTQEMSHADTTARIMTLPDAEQRELLEWHFSYAGYEEQFVRLHGGKDILLFPRGLRLGDLILAMGWGDWTEQGDYYDTSQHTQTYGYHVLIYYPEHQMTVVALLVGENPARLTPDSPIWRLMYPSGPFPTPSTQSRLTAFAQQANLTQFPTSPRIWVQVSPIP